MSAHTYYFNKDYKMVIFILSFLCTYYLEFVCKEDFFLINHLVTLKYR